MAAVADGDGRYHRMTNGAGGDYGGSGMALGAHDDAPDHSQQDLMEEHDDQTGIDVAAHMTFAAKRGIHTADNVSTEKDSCRVIDEAQAKRDYDCL